MTYDNDHVVHEDRLTLGDLVELANYGDPDEPNSADMFTKEELEGLDESIREAVQDAISQFLMEREARNES